jgi:hypothetical protein
MKRLLIILPIMMLCGCASLNYQAPDGTKVTYSRLFTQSDTIIGKIGEASIESKGQQVIDPASLKAILSVLGTLR